MKFLTIALLVLLSVSASLAGNCFQTTGYHTSFTATGFNSILPSNNGVPLSFYEAGTINVDFAQQQMAVTFDILTTDSQVLGLLYAFAANQTMYVVNIDDNGSTCTKLPLNVPIPTSFPNVTADLGPINIGKFQTEVLEIVENGSQQKVLYDLQNCALVSSYMLNEPSQPGVTTVNFLNFESTPAPISLPSICTNPSMSIKSNRHNSKSSAKTPKSIQQLLRPFF
ncbi:hypothetical protein CYY_005219 [Polysphondylium violaceum]|uniref:Carbohydrate binding domain-containing protein n=1 Tax=Polysphondylium violaceum TaxID=133409 RepID=A0A8J4USC7_9MYCE|nr:hypothetical protein CYY_005219 [Polysphondylium violaceum]